MIPFLHPLFADSATRTSFELARAQSLTEWWHWLLVVTVVAVIVAFVTMLYRRDSIELPRGLAYSLAVLRLVALFGLLVFFLRPEKRTEQKLVRHSRVVLLIDTSQSMGLRDTADSLPSGDAPSTTGAPLDAERGTGRLEQVIAELAGERFLPEIRESHDVAAYRFDQQNQPTPIAVLSKTPSPESASESDDAAFQQAARAEFNTVMLVGGALAVGACLAWLAYLAFPARSKQAEENSSWSLLVGMVLAIFSLVTFGVAHLRQPELGLFGWSEIPAVGAGSSQATENPVGRELPIEWKSALVARGVETRIGEALRYIVHQERGGPIAGIVLFTDGNNNAGIEPSLAARSAKDAGIRIYSVGLGSDRRPVNVRVVDLEAPPRAYPDDDFQITGYVQGFGIDGQSIKVELYSASADEVDASAEGIPVAPGTAEDKNGTEKQNGDRPAEKQNGVANPTKPNKGSALPVVWELEKEKSDLKIKSNGEVVRVEFQVENREVGRRVYKLRVTPPRNDADASDNERTARVHVVRRKTKVLLMAGGPTREFQFLRNVLYRDKNTTVNVLLQTGESGLSQESHGLLKTFPSEADELFEYDCVVAFDPDWLSVASGLDARQAELLEKFVAEKAGGLLLIAGPVHTPRWTSIVRGDETADILKALYPVAFYGSGVSASRLGRFGSERVAPLAFTREGEEADFLRLELSPDESREAWKSFPGVFGYFPIKEPKPGATVYARFSDAESALDNQLPVYLASQFYGAGRVFYMASGEMWRLRAVDVKYFDTLYIRIIRWITQGRLLRDSSRGVLLVDKERCLIGDTVTVRASLTDALHRPLTKAEVPAILISPEGTRSSLVLRKAKESSREGAYVAQFTATQEGDYRIEVALPQGTGEELLAREVRVRMPKQEIEKPERNSALLRELADSTGGVFYTSVASAAGKAGVPGVAQRLEPQDQTSYLAGTPDKLFERQLMTWLLVLICGALFLEWALRRLNKLA